MRYRAEYLHLPTSSRIIFTVPDSRTYEGEYVGSAGFAIARRHAQRWIEQTGIAAECAFLSVVEVTDKMSVHLEHGGQYPNLYGGRAVPERHDTVMAAGVVALPTEPDSVAPAV